MRWQFVRKTQGLWSVWWSFVESFCRQRLEAVRGGKGTLHRRHLELQRCRSSWCKCCNFTWLFQIPILINGLKFHRAVLEYENVFSKIRFGYGWNSKRQGFQKLLKPLVGCTVVDIIQIQNIQREEKSFRALCVWMPLHPMFHTAIYKILWTARCF